ncbi:probable serine/threonine-protein kinase DDB_G0282963 [Chrysoperla carnea]|uniref:probable serine/threonine-protein kinase DDB_G0282963 n=1 Tax=Chrysoperla carnea TaxID=189513 RepID=UPI001D085C17|nr:probable serine/threonine-protein kinase DDB_G0282963 [Chrysoperla carnea]XP_044735193.1 probable serine/threonine-protein kinase DDB_G0282963 [Chrysoperla carnea]
MAVSVSHAMRRHLAGPSEPPYLNYSNQQETSSPYHTRNNGGLSQSMRYTETWLYGVPPSPTQTGLILPYPPAQPLVVLCACGGTTKQRSSNKKSPSICKKCKGTKLPLPSANSPSTANDHHGTVRGNQSIRGQISGTVRGLSQNLLNNRHKYHTVRETSSKNGIKKIRPSIFDLDELDNSDPYDLMRRSRLTLTELQRTRTKSISPLRKYDTVRGRRSPSPQQKHRSRSANRNANDWLIEEQPPLIPAAPTNRRSILECNVNPYELMGKNNCLHDSVEDIPKKFSNYYEDIEINNVQSTVNKERKILAPTKELPKPVKINETKELPSRPPRKKPIEEIPKKFNQNRFKSILKKTSTFNTDSSDSSERIPSPIVQQHSSTSQTQFYLPNPAIQQQQTNDLNNLLNNIPRKKVQFLVEKSNSNESIELIVETQQTNNDEQVENEENVNNNNKNDETIDENINGMQDNVQEDDVNEETNDSCNNILAVATTNTIGNDDLVNEIINDSNEESQMKELSSRDLLVKDVNNEGFSPKLRRSNSDRISSSTTTTILTNDNNNEDLSTNNITTNTIQFNDTMALRAKNMRRTDHREVFTALQRLDGITKNDNQTNNNNNLNQRPKEPPPPPPPQPTIPVPVAPARKKQDRRKKISIDSNSSSSNDSCHSSLSSTDLSFRSVDSEIKIIESESELSTDDRKISIEVASTDSEQYFTPKLTSSPTQQTSVESTKSVIKIYNDNSNSNITSVTLNNENIPEDNSTSPYPQRTIVQITPPVHRLKIKNEFVDYQCTPQASPDNSARKTSILITGDDCYSTVNVSDDYPVYQSSVVVNDNLISSTDSKLYNRSNNSTIYISCESDERYEPINNNFNTQKIVPNNNNENKNIIRVEDDNLRQLLRDPVEAVKRNLVPHVCGKTNMIRGIKRGTKTNHNNNELGTSVVAKLLKDPELGSLVEGLESDVVAKLLQESLLKLKQDRNFIPEITKAEEKESLSSDNECNSLNSGPYEQIDLDDNDYSGSNRSSLTEDDLASTSTRSKFYQLLADASLDGSSTDDHTYETIRMNQDPIYEEIEIPPPLPLNPPPDTLPTVELDKSFTTRSIFEGASKYDILSYLVDARERGIESYAYSFANSGSVVIECDTEIEMTPRTDEMTKTNVEVERTDSGVGSESSKSSRSRYQQSGNANSNNSNNNNVTPVEPEITNPCEDCNLTVDTQVTNGDVIYTPLVCRKCSKRRAERKEIITEIVETEEKYARDLQIILEEFYQPMLVAGLLNAEQLAAVFLNVEELLENSQSFAERLRDALEISIEQGDEDLLTIDIGRLFLDAASMLHAFESYCVRQAAAGLLLANLEKEKELLRIFLKVSQMENTVLRRMNLNSFLMVPVQRVTKYPLLLIRLNKVTPAHLEEMKENLTEAQRLVEQHLGQMNASAKDVPSRLWRRLSSGRRTTSELDSVNIKLRKLAVDILEWNHEEARFALEGKLLYTQPIDSAWRRGRTIKLTPVCALLVTLGRPGAGYKSPDEETLLAFPRQTGIREAALVLARDKGGRYSLLREPLYLDRCVVATDPAWQSYFEVQELMTKDTFIFKAEDDDRTINWYRNLQYHAQGMGTWRKRRNALANIMITGISGRS